MPDRSCRRTASAQASISPLILLSSVPACCIMARTLLFADMVPIQGRPDGAESDSDLAKSRGLVFTRLSARRIRARPRKNLEFSNWNVGRITERASAVAGRTERRHATAILAALLIAHGDDQGPLQ